MERTLHTRFNAIRLTTIVCSVLLCVVLSGAAAGQADALFETASVEKRLTRQLGLTQKELKKLRPLFERENEDLLALFGYCTDEGSSDFLSLWNAVRSRRAEFENERLTGLPPRQKRALTYARIEFETRILDQWLDDHLQMLSDLLELDWVQMKYVEKVFDNEHVKRLEILKKEAGRPVRLDEQWQKLSDERERKLELILDEPQLRDYRLMTSPQRLIAKNQ